MNNIRTILAPVDFSEGALAAVRHARELADVFHGDVHLLHAMAAADTAGWAFELFGARLRPGQRQERIDALDQLATLIVSQQLNPFRTTGVVWTGCAEDVISQYADDIHADLVVRGLHGDHLIPQVRVVQVIEGVLGRVRCPVLTAPEEILPVVSLEPPASIDDPVAC